MSDKSLLILRFDTEICANWLARQALWLDHWSFSRGYDFKVKIFSGDLM